MRGTEAHTRKGTTGVEILKGSRWAPLKASERSRRRSGSDSATAALNARAQSLAHLPGTGSGPLSRCSLRAAPEHLRSWIARAPPFEGQDGGPNKPTASMAFAALGATVFLAFTDLQLELPI